jgi:phosphatidylinositol 4-phosphatase
MQGYFQPATLVIPPSPTDPDGEFTVVDYTIISRRARYRVGLRYQRRGIDDEAHVANFVETETLMKVEVGSFPSP